MAPKKDPAAQGAPAAITSPPAPAAVPAHVVAAQKVVEKWNERLEDVSKRSKTNEEQLASLLQARATREQRLKDLLAEVSVIAMPKAVEPEAPPAAAKGSKAPAAKKGAETAAAPPPPPPTLDEEELKRLHKLQNTIIAIYKKKREAKALVRDTPPPPPTASSAAGSETSRKAADDPGAADRTAGGVAAAAPPAVEEPGIVKPADLDPEIWSQVLRMRDERIETEEALAALNANVDVATARQQNLVTLDSVVHYSLDASRFELEKAKESKGPVAGAAPLQPQRPPSNPSSKQPPQRPPSQLLRR